MLLCFPHKTHRKYIINEVYYTNDDFSVILTKVPDRC